MARKNIESKRGKQIPMSARGSTAGVHLPPEMKKTIEEIAHDEERSVSQTLLRLLRVGLEHYEDKK